MKKILIVDDEPNNLQLLRQVLRSHYQLFFATDGPRALAAAEKHLPDLILLDIMMPGMDGYEVCERLKQMAATAHIPVIFITAMCEYEDEARGFDVGGVDYIQKPISSPVVLRRVQTHLSLVRARTLEDSQRETIYMMGLAGHYNDNDTGLHIWRMAAYSSHLARLLGWEDEAVERMELAAPMHDTGKIGIPDNILKAPRQLDEHEWDIMKTHAQIGYLILSRGQSALFRLAAEIALTHHERWDGSGYPQGLAGEAIPVSGRIVALADVFDALTTRRPYKQAWTVQEAVDEIMLGAGTHFDPHLVELFRSHLDDFVRIKDSWEAKESLELTPVTLQQAA
ncbi:putative two-component system response regulator [Andreprevotia lacus DSM 23236]|jgi:putative two-component system response regulator|uniref:Putative two-component system response regulator n=1 Tax=Andreprevotia lacus DSM 23236 TaxID=1121001 RepID=A0A1W1XFT7_9NEIS|nr:HD domain-containing phosphohydrolase [Andreprevotia lacus]SMC22800.1 putative two-component system response regulator [Andreprevotia lacus DSM 23236]